VLGLKKTIQWHYFLPYFIYQNWCQMSVRLYLYSLTPKIIDSKYLDISEIELCLFQNKNDVLIVISGKFKWKQRVEKTFKTYMGINKTHFDLINHSFACNTFYFLDELCKENSSKS
jgi:hypothetical protein